MGNEALLIVHLSSLDAYTDANGQEQGMLLGSTIAHVITTYPACIFVTDQEWEFLGRQCQPRQIVEEALHEHSQVIRFHHDESEDDWEEAMGRLGALLRARGIERLTIGGTWASEDGPEGCVNETERLLKRQGFLCTIDTSICGLVEE